VGCLGDTRPFLLTWYLANLKHQLGRPLTASIFYLIPSFRGAIHFYLPHLCFSSPPPPHPTHSRRCVLSPEAKLQISTFPSHFAKVTNYERRQNVGANSRDLGGLLSLWKRRRRREKKGRKSEKRRRRSMKQCCS